MLYKLMENRVYRTYTGGANIDKFYGKPVCENSSFPEDWTASVIKAFNPGREGIIEGYGRISDGSLVKDVINGEFKCLVKLLDAAERLVIQVHPTVEFAKKYFNSDFGKTECWYFLNCSEGAHVYVGFKEGVTKEQWRDVFDRQDIEKMLDMLHKVPVKSGELINNLPVDSRDYLQVFSLSPDINGQRIIHTQENPDYKKEYVFNLDTKVAGKVFVIDDGTHSTMLMNYEY